MEMTVKEVLIAARAKIADPANWTQGEYARTLEGYPLDVHSRNAECWCSIGALACVMGDVVLAEHSASHKALEDVMGTRWIAEFNDTHTHAEVLAKFDEAIAAQGGE